jgi:hypothetical protein
MRPEALPTLMGGFRGSTTDGADLVNASAARLAQEHADEC